MSKSHETMGEDATPGEQTGSVRSEVANYVLGLALALGLTMTSFWAVSSHVLWGPGIPMGLCVLAIAQMGVHLVFFLHITSGPDNTNNVMALGFGLLIVFLLLVGSLWIMDHLNATMAAMPAMPNGAMASD